MARVESVTAGALAFGGGIGAGSGLAIDAGFAGRETLYKAKKE